MVALSLVSHLYSRKDKKAPSLLAVYVKGAKHYKKPSTYNLLELYFLIIKKDGNRNFFSRAHIATLIKDGVLLEKRGQWLLDR